MTNQATCVPLSWINRIFCSMKYFITRTPSRQGQALRASLIVTFSSRIAISSVNNNHPNDNDYFSVLRRTPTLRYSISSSIIEIHSVNHGREPVARTARELNTFLIARTLSHVTTRRVCTIRTWRAFQGEKRIRWLNKHKTGLARRPNTNKITWIR